MKDEADGDRHGDDLRRRTKAFAGEVIDFFGRLERRQDEIDVLARQLLRSATSVGAQYREASRARSAEEFIAKIKACIQEADETQYWLELLRDHCSVDRDRVDPLWREANELISIFVTMSKNTVRGRA